MFGDTTLTTKRIPLSGASFVSAKTVWYRIPNIKSTPQIKKRIFTTDGLQFIKAYNLYQMHKGNIFGPNGHPIIMKM